MKRYHLKRQVLLLFFLFFTQILFSQTFVEQTGISLPSLGTPGISHGSVAWGDYNNDGYLDILLTGNGISRIYKNNGNNTFTEQTGIELTGVIGGSVAWGDYDNDGDLDILLTGSSSSIPVSKIFRNNGDNTFSEQTDIALTGVSDGSVAWGDYDNDGNPDILLTGQSLSGPVSKIYHNNGNNTFTEQTNIALTGVWGGSVAWGDYDNDGYLDILYIGNTPSDRISRIYHNNGDNTFTEQTNITLPGIQTGSLAWGDYDNDGYLDILLTGWGYARVYRNNGDNTFTDQTSIKLGDVNTSSAAWGDYDNDGKMDILMTGQSSSGYISKIFHNNGDNTFTEQTGIALTGVASGSVAWGDYDNDGNLDILLTGNTGSGYISKVYRNETATPNVKPAMPTNLQTVISNGIVTFTWDKSLDKEKPQNGLNYNLYVYEAGQSNYECTPNAFKQSETNNGKRLIAKPGNIQWRSNGYSIKNLLPGKTYSWSVQAINGGLQGSNFSPEQSFTIPGYRPVTQANNITFSNIQTNQATATWANGGGVKHAVFLKAAATGTADPVDNITYSVNDITPGGWKCVYNGTDNSLLLSGLATNTNYLVHVCEYNGTAGNEIYLRSAAFQNPAALNILFTEQTGISLTGVYDGKIAWGDYDNDGKLDILLSGNTPNIGFPCKIYRNNGDNTFTEQTGISLTRVWLNAAAWGDYDNDGDLDILLAGNTDSGDISKIFRNNGNNTFTEQTNISLIGVESGSVAWGDYDNDGDLDILLTGISSSGYISRIYRNNGDNSFTLQTGIALIGVGSSSAAWGDYDNDGYLDILLTGTTNGLPSGAISKVYRNNRDNTFTEQTGITLIGVEGSSVAWGDYDNDGYPDILLTGQASSGPVSKIYRNNGNNSFTEQTGISLKGVLNCSAAWGDYDNDGYLDILLTGDAGSGYISKIYRNNKNNTFTEQTGITLTGANSVAWGDYDSDNDLDILLTGTDLYGNPVSKVFRNEILTPDIKPSVPAGLQSYWDNNCIIFKWNKASDNTTPPKAIRYNLRIGTIPGGNEVKSSQALPTGKLLIPDINNLTNDTCIKYKLPFNKYYWSVQSVDKSGSTSSFAPEMITPLDSIQAKNLQASIKSNNSMLIRWKNGNGFRRALFGRLSSQATNAKPVDGTIYVAEPYFGQGDKIGTTGWYCMYNGKADSVIIYGLDKEYSYDIQVVEYIEANGLPEYFRTTGNGNPGVFSSSIFSEQTNIGLTGVASNSSVAWGDYDNDGYLDILLAGREASGWPVTKVYHNNGDNTFTEQTGITLIGVDGCSAAWGDYDNDGNLDILLTGRSVLGPVSKIYHNNGDNTFTELTGISLTGVQNGTMALGDYDNNGKLDILLTGYTGSENISKIYSNNGDNTFSEQAGISLTGAGFAAWGDYDNDGDLDILLTGCVSGPVSKIYRNNGNNTFTEQTSFLFGFSNSGSTWSDYNNDGYLDIFLTGAPWGLPEYAVSSIYSNNGNNSFTEQNGTGLDAHGVSVSSQAWGDYDNDGYLDIILTGQTSSGPVSRIYHNNGNNTFTEQTEINLTGVYNGSVAWGDYDNDGDLDILLTGNYDNTDQAISKIYRNNTIMKAGNFSANKKPAAPGKLLTTSQPSGTTLSWSPVKTDETPYKSMTYDVRIGTAPGKSNILSAQSNPVNGFRSIAGMGNAQLDTTFLIKNLSSGKYYWSVHAVDQGYKGGAWSAVDSFIVKNVQSFFSADTVCLGLPTRFTDQSVATDGIASWSWDFKDGTTSSLQNPSHTFLTSGIHNIKLVISSIGAIKDSLEKSVIIKPRPLTDFSATTACQGTETTLVNLTNSSGLNITSWSWDYGDNKGSISQNPGSHGYLSAGFYNLTLTALADNGCSGIVTKIVTVGVFPVAAITTNTTLSFCSGDSVTLAVNSNQDYTYKWMLNNTGITNAIKNYYTAKLSGNYSVEVTNSKGSCSTTSSQISVTCLAMPVTPEIITENYQEGKCPGETPIVLKVDQPVTDYTYLWKRNGAPFNNTAISKLEGYLPAGDYSVIASKAGCQTESRIKSIVFDVSPDKPYVYAKGPTVWYLVCSNDTATQYKWYYNGTLIPGADKYMYVANQKLGKYNVSIANTKGCFTLSDTITIPKGFTGIEDVDPFAGMIIYPNPTSGLFTIELKNQLFGEVAISILDQGGKEILNTKTEKTAEHFSKQIDLSTYSKGIYIIKTNINNRTDTRKVIVK